MPDLDASVDSEPRPESGRSPAVVVGEPEPPWRSKRRRLRRARKAFGLSLIQAPAVAVVAIAASRTAELLRSYQSDYRLTHLPSDACVLRRRGTLPEPHRRATPSAHRLRASSARLSSLIAATGTPFLF